MKKLITITSILLILIAVQAKAITWSIFSIENDTTTQGNSFTMIVDGANGTPTDTGRIYIHHAPTNTYIELFKINTNDRNTLTPSGAHYIITVTLPAGIKGNVDFYTNGSSAIYYCFIRSNTPDLNLVQVPGLNGPFSGYTGYGIHFKFKWSYESIIADTVRFYLDGLECYKISLSEIEDDSVVDFPINGSPGNKYLTINYSDFEAPITINEVTNIVEPFSYTTRRNVPYYDLLGRSVTPKEGDLIRYTTFGAVVLNQ